MLKLVISGTTALFLATSGIASAQTSTAPPVQLSAADSQTLTDMRVDLVKAALQLTPDQEKFWPAIETAIRARADNRKARLANASETVGKAADAAADAGRLDAIRNRDPTAFMQRRSEALAQRSADLDKLAKAWQPLYTTLKPEQKKRMAALGIFVLRDMSDSVEQRLSDAQDMDD
jgi:hypothetical protein